MRINKALIAALISICLTVSLAAYGYINERQAIAWAEEERNRLFPEGPYVDTEASAFYDEETGIYDLETLVGHYGWDTMFIKTGSVEYRVMNSKAGNACLIIRLHDNYSEMIIRDFGVFASIRVEREFAGKYVQVKDGGLAPTDFLVAANAVLHYLSSDQYPSFVEEDIEDIHVGDVRVGALTYDEAMDGLYYAGADVYTFILEWYDELTWDFDLYGFLDHYGFKHGLERDNGVFSITSDDGSDVGPGVSLTLDANQSTFVIRGVEGINYIYGYVPADMYPSRLIGYNDTVPRVLLVALNAVLDCCSDLNPNYKSPLIERLGWLDFPGAILEISDNTDVLPEPDIPISYIGNKCVYPYGELDQKWTVGSQMDIASMFKDCCFDRCNLDDVGYAAVGKYAEVWLYSTDKDSGVINAFRIKTNYLDVELTRFNDRVVRGTTDGSLISRDILHALQFSLRAAYLWPSQLDYQMNWLVTDNELGEDLQLVYLWSSEFDYW